MTKIEYLLICLSEECAEVGKQSCKALRFGLDRYEPGHELTNAQRIVAELTDVMAIVEMLVESGGIKDPPWIDSQTAIGTKKKRVLDLMEDQK